MIPVVALKVPAALPLASGLELPKSHRNTGHRLPRPREPSVWNDGLQSLGTEPLLR